MKKLFLSVAVAFSVFALASCGGSKKNPIDEIVGAYEKATTDVLKAQSYDDVLAVDAALKTEIDAIWERNKDYEETEEEFKRRNWVGAEFYCIRDSVAYLFKPQFEELEVEEESEY